MKMAGISIKLVQLRNIEIVAMMEMRRSMMISVRLQRYLIVSVLAEASCVGSIFRGVTREKSNHR